MDESRLQRAGLLAGVLFVALTVAGAALAGRPPKGSDDANTILRYLDEHRQELKAAAVLFGLSLFVGLWFVAALWRVISRGSEDVQRTGVIVVVTFVVGAALSAVGMIATTTAAMRLPRIDPSVVEVLWTISSTALAFALAATALQMATLAVHTVRTQMLPRWTAYLAGVSAGCSLVGVAAAGSERSYFAAVGFAGFITWMAWIVTASFILANREPAV